MNSENPWDQKSLAIMYVDLVVDFFKMVTYSIFFGVIVHYYGIPLYILRDVYMSFRSFAKVFF